MIAQILSAVGLAASPLESDDLATRTKAEKDFVDAQNREAEQEQAEAARKAQAASNARFAALAKARELKAQKETKLEAEIASDLRTAIAKLWPAFRKQPNRATTAPFAEVLEAASERAIECLGADVSIATIWSAFADAYVQRDQMMANVMNPTQYPHFGERAGALLAIVHSAGLHGVDLGRLQAALEALEATLHAVQPRGEVNQKALAEWDILLAHTTARGLAPALAAHRNAKRAAALAAQPPAPPPAVFKTTIKNASTGEVVADPEPVPGL